MIAGSSSTASSGISQNLRQVTLEGPTVTSQTLLSLPTPRATPSNQRGRTVIQRYAGRDASRAYNNIHAPSLIQSELGDTKRIGDFVAAGVPPGSDILTPPESPAAPPPPTAARDASRRPLQTLLSTHDLEQAASENLSAKAWAFFSSAATDCITQRANEAYFGRMWLRPRILKDVRDVNCRTKILGNDVSMPLFASPTAMCKLAHPDGELVIAKGCERGGIAQTVRKEPKSPKLVVILST